MSQPSLTERLVTAHLRSGDLRAGTQICLDADQVLIEDATGPMACLQFEQLSRPHVAVPLAVMYVDHNVIQLDSAEMDQRRYLSDFCARYGLVYSAPGNGISHYVHLEQYALPGKLLVGADSHTTMAGALGMLAVGAGGLDVAAAMAGYGYWMEYPEVVGVELTASLSPWVQAKDVVLEMLRRLGTQGGRGKFFEFYGPGVATLSITERGTICNMIVETGATGAIFPADDRAYAWLKAHGRGDAFREFLTSPDAAYAATDSIDLSTLVPLVAVPPSPGNVVPVAEVEGLEVAQVCIGSSVNSSYEDLAIVAEVLSKAGIARSLEVTVTPGSRTILEQIADTGVLQALLGAGARILEVACGPCIGAGQAPPAGEPSVRTFNRNFPGRSGTADDRIYLVSPATAAATALRGVLTDPRRLGAEPAIRVPRSTSAPPPQPVLLDQGTEDGPVEIAGVASLAVPPRADPLPETLNAQILIDLPDDVSTGDMAPDGVLGMRLWGNIAQCAEYMFRRHDPEFPARARQAGGGVIVAGYNYGQGSSREAAVLSAVYLGVSVVIARSFARIHRQNLISQGIAPLILPEGEPAALRVGQTVSIKGLRTALAGGNTAVDLDSDGRVTSLALDLTKRERDLLLAGGLLAYLNQGRR